MELSVTLHEPHRRTELFGAGDRHLRRLRETLGIRIEARSGNLRLVGEAAEVAKAAAVIDQLQRKLRGQPDLDDDDVADALVEVEQRDHDQDPCSLAGFARHTTVAPRTDGQRHYIQSMLDYDLTFCLGPAGTGKTYLAVAVATHLLRLGRTKRIALVRPAVEAGERLGFLPGDLQQKVNPYLRPLFDAMHDLMTYDQLKRFMVSDVVEVIPLAYMRGRTLNHATIILDEAQNTTPGQMLMFLTRLGQESKMIVTGDDSQVDLEPGQPSGLIDAVQKLRGVHGISIVRLTDADIVRHRLVHSIVNRYAAASPRRTNGAEAKSDNE
jgi:phosphate starvation-inducible PhoH-like protein